MKQTTFNKTVGMIFALLAFVHGVRILSQWQVIVAGVEIPMWVSILAVAVGGFLAFSSYTLSTKTRKK